MLEKNGASAIYQEKFTDAKRETRTESASAKQNPGYREGRKPPYNKKQLEHALDMQESHSYSQVAEKTGISKSTRIRAMKKKSRAANNLNKSYINER